MRGSELVASVRRSVDWYRFNLACALWRWSRPSIRRLFRIDKVLLFSIVNPFTLVSRARLGNTLDLARHCIQHHIAGSFVECGVWRGGSAAIAAYIAQSTETTRCVHLFDSFQGLPEPTEADGHAALRYADGRGTGHLVSIAKCSAPREDAARLLFDLLHLDASGVVFHEGWFQDTLPAARETIGPIALLRLDGDWYESTKVCLEQLYDLVVPGGFVILDDYGHWEGCRRAVDEFLAKQPGTIDLISVDYTGRFFQKPLLALLADRS